LLSADRKFLFIVPCFSGGEEALFMFGAVLTYDVYHLALYLLSALGWGALGLRPLLHGSGRGALLRCCGLFAVALLFNGVMLLLDIQRVLEHGQVVSVLLIGGGLVPGVLLLMGRSGIFVGKKSLNLL
jgi:hypothetical protein